MSRYNQNQTATMNTNNLTHKKNNLQDTFKWKNIFSQSNYCTFSFSALLCNGDLQTPSKHKLRN